MRFLFAQLHSEKRCEFLLPFHPICQYADDSTFPRMWWNITISKPSNGHINHETMRQHAKIQPMSLVQAPTKTRSFFPWFPRFRDPGSPEDNCLMLVEVDSRESNSDILLFVVEMMSQIHVFGNSAVLRKLATPSNSMYHLQCQLCLWESQFWDEGLHVGCAGFIGPQTPDNRSTCQLHCWQCVHMIPLCPPEIQHPYWRWLVGKRMKKVFPASVSYIYISSGWIFVLQRKWTKLKRIGSSPQLAIRNIRNDLKSTRRPGHLSPVSHHFCARSTIYSVKSMTLVSTGGGSRVSLELLPYSVFMGKSRSPMANLNIKLKYKQDILEE